MSDVPPPWPSSGSFNPNAAQRPRRPLDVYAIDQGMACVPSTAFATCAGCVTFRGGKDDPRVLAVFNEKYTTDLWQLPKGRKNIGEDALSVTAVRETYEETGYRVRLISDNIFTRATPAEGKDQPGPHGPVFTAQCPEPIAMVHYAEPDVGTDGPFINKVCFFYAATLIEEVLPVEGTQDEEEVLNAHWLTLDDALRKLTFAAERQALQIAYHYL